MDSSSLASTVKHTTATFDFMDPDMDASDPNHDPVGLSGGLVAFQMWFAGVHGYASIAVCIFGVTTNIINITILARKDMRTPTNVLLLWLAVSDILTMIPYVPFAANFYCPPADPFTNPELFSFGWMVFMLVMVNFVATTHTVSIWIGVSLAAFRFLQMRSTSRGHVANERRIRQVKMVTLAVYVSSCLVLIPNYLTNKLRKVSFPRPPPSHHLYNHHLPNHNISSTPFTITAPPVAHTTQDLHLATATTLNSSTAVFNATATTTTTTASAFSDVNTVTYYAMEDLQLATNQTATLVIVNVVMYAVVAKLIPCVLILIFSGSLVHTLTLKGRGRRRRLATSSCSKTSARERRATTTRMLLVVIVLFLVTELPQGILILLSASVPGFYGSVYLPLGDLMDFVALINNSINFVLYCIMSQQFRARFAHMYLRRRRVRLKSAVACETTTTTATGTACVMEKLTLREPPTRATGVE